MVLFAGQTSAEPPSEAVVVADPDYGVQGEYVGKDHSMQVIAEGDGEFLIVVHEGGLPPSKLANTPPRRLNGDADTVAELCDSLGLTRFERVSPTLNAKPPAGATVLFDGTQKSLDHWKQGRISDDGFLCQGTETKEVFGDYSLHLEFRTPWMPTARGQQRGNSGVYHQGRYETQVLDSFGLTGRDNETGGIYSIKAPDANACLPPMRWQTYDVDFTAARYGGDQKVSDARMTVRLNGVTVHQDVVVSRSTTAAPYPEGPQSGPLYLQDHGNEVRFRNIWLVPRDAAREAQRPIVPGFERFFANNDDPKALGGELLISSLGCVACHEGQSNALPVKKGPNLSDVAARVRPDALVDMIADPHATKTGTTMPDLWNGRQDNARRESAEAIASFLLLDGQPKPLVDRPSKPSTLEHGERLYHSVGCTMCHPSFQGVSLPTATTVPLGDVARKYTLDSLTQLIAHPHQIRPGARMPALVGSVSDAYQIASYLTGEVTAREGQVTFQRRIYKGSWSRLPDFKSLVPVAEDQVSGLDLSIDSDLGNTGIVYESEVQIPVAGEYRFSIASDDGSRLNIGDHELVNDGIHPTQVRTATWQLEPGVYPVRVEWFNGGGEVSLSVQVVDPLLGEISLEELIASASEDSGPLLASRFQPDPGLIDEGKRLFETAGCAACHDFRGMRSVAQSPPTLLELRDQRGCLAETVAMPAVDYRLSPRQRLAIGAALQRRRAASNTAASDATASDAAKQWDDADVVHLTMAGLNCYACHRRDAVGGPETARDPLFQSTTEEMGWESRLPPTLDGVAAKLQSGYLTSLMANGANDRPYMLTRMPGFGDGHLATLQDALTALDLSQSQGPAQPADAAAEDDHVADGRVLVGANGLSCVKCHAYNGVKGSGIGVLDLLAMPKRLRPDWFARYLQNPTQYRPGTRMPNSFPEGRSTYTKLYDGDPHRQIAAMWEYLSAGPDAKEPAGLRPGAILLTPTEQPLVYRNFFEGVTGRGIAIGFPEQSHLIWDAERMGLATVWKYEFIDASRHWSGRGQGRTRPAGDQVLSLERWTPLVQADAVDVTWPEASGRELGYRFLGYQFDESDTPRFRYRVGQCEVSDSVRPSDLSQMERQITVTPTDSQTGSPQSLVWRLAVADAITMTDAAGVGQDASTRVATTPSDQTQRFDVGDVEFVISGVACQIISQGGKQELRAIIPVDQPITVRQIIRW